MEEPGRLQSMGSRRVGHEKFHFSLSCIGEGNGNLLQCSCLEDFMDRGAWQATGRRVLRVGRDSGTERACMHSHSYHLAHVDFIPDSV